MLFYDLGGDTFYTVLLQRKGDSLEYLVISAADCVTVNIRAEMYKLFPKILKRYLLNKQHEIIYLII